MEVCYAANDRRDTRRLRVGIPLPEVLIVAVTARPTPRVRFAMRISVRRTYRFRIAGGRDIARIERRARTAVPRSSSPIRCIPVRFAAVLIGVLRIQFGYVGIGAVSPACALRRPYQQVNNLIQFG